MRKIAAVLAGSIAMLASSGSAVAVPISQVLTFSGSLIDAEAVTPFDTTLGTLDSVAIEIQGTLSVNGVESPFLTGGTVPVPTPYSYTVEVQQRFFGLAGHYFAFFDPARFRFDRVASGAGGSFGFATTFTYGFTFTAASDLAGFVVPSVSTTLGVLIPPLSGIGAQRADFFDDGLPPDEIDLIQSASATSMGPVPVTVSSFNTNAIMEIRYDYTPRIAEVPAPGSAVLLLAAGGALLGARRSRRARRGTPRT